MTATEVIVQLDAIDAMERGVVVSRDVVARSLLTLRVEAGVSLRDVAPSVGVTAQTINNIERGRTWTPKTVRKMALYYRRFESQQSH